MSKRTNTKFSECSARERDFLQNFRDLFGTKKLDFQDALHGSAIFNDKVEEKLYSVTTGVRLQF